MESGLVSISLATCPSSSHLVSLWLAKTASVQWQPLGLQIPVNNVRESVSCTQKTRSSPLQTKQSSCQNQHTNSHKGLQKDLYSHEGLTSHEGLQRCSHWGLKSRGRPIQESLTLLEPHVAATQVVQKISFPIVKVKYYNSISHNPTIKTMLFSAKLLPNEPCTQAEASFAWCIGQPMSPTSWETHFCALGQSSPGHWHTSLFLQ